MTHAKWCFILGAFLFGAAAFAQSESAPPRLVVNERVVQTDVAPRIEAGTTLVPIRFVAEALGARISWDPARRQAEVLHEGTRILLQPGNARLTVGERTVEAGVPPRVLQGRLMVPLRAIAESLGATVNWEPGTRTAAIHTRPAGTPPADVTRGLEVRLEIPHESYRQGEAVAMTLRLRNAGDEPVRLQFATGQTHDFIVQQNGAEVWRWSAGMAFTQAVTSLTLLPDETRTFTATWDQRDSAGSAVAPGTFTVIGTIPRIDAAPLLAVQTIQITR